MEKRLRELVKNLDHEDLFKLKRDLDETNGMYLKELVKQKLRDIEDSEKKMCVSCGNEINTYLIDDFCLTFGPRDFKKRAYFCGIDCMEFFVNKMKEDKQRRLAKL